MNGFFREQKMLVALLAVSVLVILAGLIMIQYTQHQDEQSLVNSTEVLAESAQVEKTIATMNTIAEMAGQQLENSKQPQTSGAAVGDTKPQASLDRVAALNGRIPDVGSDDWCEVMMVKDDSAWTTNEQEIFATHCL
jgi:hypothetical protein